MSPQRTLCLAFVATTTIVVAQVPRQAQYVPAPVNRGSPIALQSLICENIETAAVADRRNATRAMDTPKSWIHIRDTAQQTVADNLTHGLAALSINGRSLSLQPVQLVRSGPNITELRYFRVSDRDGAEVIISAVREDLARLRPNDLSGEYAQATWIQRGHYELWLAPADVERRMAGNHARGRAMHRSIN